MPERFLLQILRSLVNSGVLRSTRGVEGGYTLRRPPDQVSLLELIEAIDGPIQSGTAGKNPQDATNVSLQAALQSVADTSRRQLEAIKLSQLVVGNSVPPPSTASAYDSFATGSEEP